jgi:hypothetical protein
MAISTFEADEIVARANVNQRINQANAYFPVSVANGGTGKTSLTSGQILLGNGTSGITSTATLPVTKGGTGTTSLTSGNILIGNGTSGITSTSYLSVSKGGTGQTSLTSGNILLGNGTSGITSTNILPQSKGGTGVSDFYESGSWTPTIENGAGQYLSRSGIYYRIGEMVFVSCYLQVVGTSSSSSYEVIIKGLPYKAQAKDFACAIGEARGLTNEPVTAQLYSTFIKFIGAVKSGNYYVTPHLTNGTWAYLNVSCWYKRA